MEIKFNYKNEEIILKEEENKGIGKVFPTLQEAVDKVSLGHGADFVVITEEQLEQIRNGATLGIDNGEVSAFILVEKKDKDTNETSSPL